MESRKTNYVGFGIRFIAAAIDSIIFFLAFWIIGRFFIYLPLSLIKITLISIAINMIAEAIYEIFLTSKYGGTVGKILMKCKVVNSKGNNISISNSIIRYFSKWLSALALWIGCHYKISRILSWKRFFIFFSNFIFYVLLKYKYHLIFINFW